MSTRQNDGIPPLSSTYIRDQTEKSFGKRPCLWQIKVTEEILKGKDVVSIAGTGMGKTLTFWMPILFRPQGHLQIVVTPLNILGKQNVEILAKAGLRGIFIGADTATSENFQAIENLHYHAVIISPEQLMKEGTHIHKLFKSDLFTSRIISVIFDEAHCISAWGSFRPEYSQVGRLRYLLPRSIPMMVTSATLPKNVLHDIQTTLQFRADKTYISRRTCDRSNIYIDVRKMKHTFSSFKDLAFIIGEWKPGQPPPDKFLVFFDSINDSINACRYLWTLVPPEFRSKIKWYCSEMSERYKIAETQNIKEGRLWGMMSTESFGMGIDISDLLRVVQWRAHCSYPTFWQRGGRGARDPSLQATYSFLVEPEYFDEERARKVEVAAERERKKDNAAAKKKRPNTNVDGLEVQAYVKHRKGNNNPHIPVLVKTVPPLQDAEAETSNGLEVSIPSGNGEESESEDVVAGLQEKYFSHENQGGGPKRSMKKWTIDHVVDDVVNARERGLKCHRIPILAALENEKAALDFHECDQAHTDGCTRCGVPVTVLCCNICNPDYSSTFELASAETSRPQRSRLKKIFTMTPSDTALKKQLEEWRVGKTRVEFGAGHLRDLGPGLVLPNEILDRIVHCVHASKIIIASDIERETQPWVDATVYGEEIFAIIQSQSLPGPLLTSTSACPTQAANHITLSTLASASGNTPIPGPSSTKKRGPYQCSKCHAIGHTARSNMCPKNSSSKENTPAVPPPT